MASLLSVVIVTHNSEQFLEGCLSSVQSQVVTDPFEVIVVDNASEDGSRKLLLEKFDQVTLIKHATNRGFAAANNDGIQAVSGKFVLLLNVDTIVAPGAFQAMVSHLLADHRIGALGPKILNRDGSLQRTGVSFPSLWSVLSESLFLDILFPTSRLFGRHRRLFDSPDSIHDVDYLQGSCLLLRKEALDECGVLDEKFFMYFEENDLCRRMKNNGWVVRYIPDAVITHFGGGSTGYYDQDRIAMFHRSYLLYLRKHEHVVRGMLFRVLLFLRALVRAFLFVLCGMILSRRRREFFSRMRGNIAAMKIMVGLKR